MYEKRGKERDYGADAEGPGAGGKGGFDRRQLRRGTLTFRPR